MTEILKMQKQLKEVALKKYGTKITVTSPLGVSRYPCVQLQAMFCGVLKVQKGGSICVGSLFLTVLLGC